MVLLTRRDAGKRLVAGVAAVAAVRAPLWGADWIDSVFSGVQIGAQSYSFRDRPLAEAIKGYQEVGLGECELWEGHVEPKTEDPKKMREWRLSAPLSQFHDVRRQFDDAGVKLYAFNYSFSKNMTDNEYDRGFQMAEALGVKYITASSQVSIAPKVDQYAQKYKITVGFHGHDNTRNPDEFSTAETFARAMDGASPYIGVNLDIGHFVAAGGDPVAYIRQHHDRIVTLHIKDRKKNHGANEPFGQGDTNITGVLQLLRDNHYPIPANIEYEYGKPGMDTIAEMKRCVAYCKAALT
jgi:sugar phosphate isomerase/epimerase